MTSSPRSIVVDAAGPILVLYDYDDPHAMIVRVNPLTGYRTIEHSFADPSLGDDVSYALQIAIRQ